MTTVLIVVLVLGVLSVAVLGQRRAAAHAAMAQQAGRDLHLRSLAFPAVCSWCKDTTLARKLIVYERAGHAWSPYDPQRGLLSASSTALEGAVHAIFQQTNPTWRRFCTERCVRAFFASEHVELTTTFAPCAYCSVRFPASVTACPNCAALRGGECRG